MSTSMNEKIARYWQLRDQLDAIKNEIDVCLDSLLADCPIKVGDIVEAGPGSGAKMQVEHIRTSDTHWTSRGEPYWSARGPLLKKNGTPGLRSGRWSETMPLPEGRKGHA